MFQVLQQRADGLVALLGELPMLHLDVVVAVPRLAFAVPDLHEAHAALDEPSRRENLPRLRALAIHRADVRRLLADVERVRRLHLHPVGQLEGCDARFELSLARTGRRVALVQGAEQIQLRSLVADGNLLVVDVLDEPLDARLGGVEVGALEDAGEKGALPVLRLLNRVAARAHRDEAGEILVLRAEAVSDPRAHARARQARVAAVEQHERRLVVGHVRVHRADDADVVNALRRLRENLTDLDAAPAVFLELVGRAEGRAGAALGAEFVGQRFAVMLIERGLGVERVHVGRAAVEEDVDDALGLRCEVRGLRSER